MRDQYRVILRNFFRAHLRRESERLNKTHAQMASMLAMDERSYLDLDHGKTCCSAVTLVLFLLYCREKPAAFIKGLRAAFEREGASEAV